MRVQRLMICTDYYDSDTIVYKSNKTRMFTHSDTTGNNRNSKQWWNDRCIAYKMFVGAFF